MTGHDAESTSAALARVERERDEAWKFLAVRAEQLDGADLEIIRLGLELHLARAELASAQQELDALRTVRDQLGRDLATAEQAISDLDDESTSRLIDELQRERDRAVIDVLSLRRGLRREVSWIVARDGGRDCVDCDGEIQRGHAYEFRGIDELAHIHCPDPPLTDRPARPLEGETS